MADTTYILNQEYPEGIPGFEQYQDSDKNLITSFPLNSLFDPTKNFVELHVVDLADDLLESDYKYSRYTLSANAASAGKEGASVLTIDPIQDSLSYGYSFGGVKLLYHFLNDLYTSDASTLEFYIDSISPDRTELSLLTNNLTPEEVVKYTDSIKTKLTTQSYFNEFRLDFKDNNLLIGVNIDNLDTQNGKSVVVKLYEPLPDTFRVKSRLNILETVSDSVAYEVDYSLSEPEVVLPTLRSANFNIDIQDDSVIPTQYFNYDELLSYKVNNTNSEIYSMINEKGVELSIDYTDYSNFIHFSSAQERLLNFKYKVDLLTAYSQSLSTTSTVTGGSQGVSGSRTYYENLYQGIVNNFDHYERFLYYESGSSSWPKSNNTKPYINYPSSNQIAIDWYSDALTDSVAYDSSNYNALVETVPTYLRDDNSNDNYLTFIHMIGQHFDNLWIYGEAVTDKYDNDNRPDFGISKDLVGEALKNFGVKLYTSNKSTEDLFSTFIGQAYQSGSEKINNYITGSLTGSNASIQPSSFDNYQKEVQKRIYHNLPLLLKSKGTERGLRALINCYGIPADILDIKIYGGRNIQERPFYGDYQNYTSSLNKVRLDNTGSLISGSTLSSYVSTIKRDNKYTDDLHAIEIGFSPSDSVDNYIISKSASGGAFSNFNIDAYIGDPRNLELNEYYTYGTSTLIASQSLSDVTNVIMNGTTAYNVQDFVRLIKFFDNTIFKMVKDFIPARSVADVGIIIKPHLLSRSKAKSLTLSGSRPEYSASIDTAFISSSNGGSFTTSIGDSFTSYTDSVQTPTGIFTTGRHSQEEARLDGQLDGSTLTLSTVNLNSANPYKDVTVDPNYFNVNFVSSSIEVCLLTLKPGYPTPYKFITSSTELYYGTDFFQGTNGNVAYTTDQGNTPGSYITTSFPRVFGGINTGTAFNIKATNTSTCTQVAPVMFATCSLIPTQFASNLTVVSPTSTYNFDMWWNIHPDQLTPGNMVAVVTWYVGAVQQGILVVRPNNDWYNFRFTQAEGTEVTVTLTDWRMQTVCSNTKKVTVGTCNLLPLTTTNTVGFEFTPSTVVTLPTVGTRALRWLGRRYSATSGYEVIESSAQNNTGVQGYFLPYPQPASTKYIVYRIYRTTTGTLGANSFRGEVYTTTSAPYGAINPNTFNSEYEGTAWNPTGNNGPWVPINVNPRSIGINTDDRNLLFGTTSQDYPVSDTSRVYAYIVKAYNSLTSGVNPTTLGGCISSVTIYRSYNRTNTPVLTSIYATIPITWATNLDGTPIVGNNIENIQMRVRTNPI